MPVHTHVSVVHVCMFPWSTCMYVGPFPWYISMYVSMVPVCMYSVCVCTCVTGMLVPKNPSSFFDVVREFL